MFTSTISIPKPIRKITLPIWATFPKLWFLNRNHSFILNLCKLDQTYLLIYNPLTWQIYYIMIYLYYGKTKNWKENYAMKFRVEKRIANERNHFFYTSFNRTFGPPKRWRAVKAARKLELDSFKRAVMKISY